MRLGRRFLPILLASSIGACAHAPPPADVGATTSARTTPGDTARSRPTDDPCRPIFALSVDLARIAELRASVIPTLRPEVASITADLLDLPDETLVAGRVLEARGLDRTRSVNFALCAPDDALRARSIALAALAPDHSGATIEAAGEATVRRILEVGEPGFVGARLELPIGDAERLRAYVDALLGASTVRANGAAGGYDAIYLAEDGSLVVGLAQHDGALILELFAMPMRPRQAPGSPTRPARLLAVLLERGRPGLPPSAIATEGDLARAHEVPGELAELNFLLGVGEVLEAVAGVDPASRGRILGEGLYEASRSLVVAGDAAGPYFTSIAWRMDARGSSELRAEARGEDVLPSEAAFHPAHSLAVRGAGGLFAVAPRFVLDFPMPGGDRFRETTSAEDPPAFHHLALLAGGMTPLIAAPHRMLDWVTTAMMQETLPRSGEAPAALFARFDELLAVQTTDRTHARVGLVAEDADARAAACSFFADPRPCLTRLREDRPLSTDAEHAVLLTRVGDRRVVIDALDAESARRIAAGVSIVDGGSPVRVTLTREGLRELDFAEVLTGTCGVSGSVRREGRALIVAVAHEPCATAP